MDLWFCLSKENKDKLARFYEENFGMKLVPPRRDRRAIHCEVKIEDTAEISRLMQESPNYSLDVQGREQ